MTTGCRDMRDNLTSATRIATRQKTIQITSQVRTFPELYIELEEAVSITHYSTSLYIVRGRQPFFPSLTEASAAHTPFDL
jgi:hypothetical protein